MQTKIKYFVAGVLVTMLSIVTQQAVKHSQDGLLASVFYAFEDDAGGGDMPPPDMPPPPDDMPPPTDHYYDPAQDAGYDPGSYDGGSHDGYQPGSYDGGSHDDYQPGSYDGGSYDDYQPGSYEDDPAMHDNYYPGPHDDPAMHDNYYPPMPPMDGGAYPPYDSTYDPAANGGYYPPMPPMDGNNYPPMPPMDGNYYPPMPPMDGNYYPPHEGGEYDSTHYPEHDEGYYPAAGDNYYPPMPPMDGNYYPPHDGGYDPAMNGHYYPPMPPMHDNYYPPAPGTWQPPERHMPDPMEMQNGSYMFNKDTEFNFEDNNYNAGDMQQTLRDNLNELRDAKRQLQECRGNLNDYEYGKLEDAYGDWHQKVTQLQGLTTNLFDDSSFWDLVEELDGLKTMFWKGVDACHDAVELDGLRDYMRHTNNAIGHDVKRQIQEFERLGMDMSEIRGKLQECEHLVTTVDTSIGQGNLAGSASNAVKQDLDNCMKDLHYLLGNMQNQMHSDTNRHNPEPFNHNVDMRYPEPMHNDMDMQYHDPMHNDMDMQHQEHMLRDMERIIKEKRRMIEREMGREFTRMSRDGMTIDGSMCQDNLNRLIGELEQAFEEYKATGDDYMFWDIDQEINYQQQDCWHEMNAVRDSHDMERRMHEWDRDMKRKHMEIRHMEQNFDNLPEPMRAKFEEMKGILGEMEGRFEENRGFIESGNFEDARDMMDFEYHDLQYEFDNMRPQMEMMHESRFMKRELENTLREIERAPARIDQMLADGRVGNDDGEHCKTFIETTARPSMQEALSHLETGDFKWMEENRYMMEDLEYEGERLCFFLFEDDHFSRPDYHGFVEEDFHGVNKDMLRGMLEEMTEDIAHKVMTKIMSVQPDKIDNFTAKAGPEFQNVAVDTLESLSYIPHAYQEEIIEEKTEVLEYANGVKSVLSALENTRSHLMAQLNKVDDVIAKITQYNFIGETGADVKAKMNEFIAQSGSMSEAELIAKIQELEMEADSSIHEAREEKFMKGVIPFKDTDDHEWYTRYVVVVKDEGIVEGKRGPDGQLLGEFAPTDEVTVGEVLKIALESSGVGSTYQPTAGEHWATGYQQEAQNYGLYFEDLNRPATRAEVTMMLLKLMGIEPADDGAPRFGDVPTTHPHFGYVNAAYDLNMIQGDSATGNFRPNDGINRAESAKLVTNLLQRQ